MSRKTPTVVRTCVGFDRWLTNAKKGDVCLYYVGNLMAAVQPLPKQKKETLSAKALDDAFARINRTKMRAACVRLASEKGLVVLTQKKWRDKGGKWAYLATYCAPPPRATHAPGVPIRYGKAA